MRINRHDICPWEKEGHIFSEYKGWINVRGFNRLLRLFLNKTFSDSYEGKKILEIRLK